MLPAFIDAEGIRKAILEANNDDSCIGVMAWMHTFSPSRLWIAGLKALNKPLLHWHTQFNRDLPFSTINPAFMDLNQAAHGDREFAHILTRMNVRRKTVVGHATNPTVVSSIDSWLRACLGANELSRLRLCRFGDNMRLVADTDGDKTQMQIMTGAVVETFGTTDALPFINGASESEINELVEQCTELYEVSADLLPGGAAHTSLRYALAQEIGIKAFLDHHGSNAWAMTFEDMPGLTQLPGFAAQRLQAQGYGYGPEGNWKTPLFSRASMVMAQGLPGGTSIMEDYTYHLQPGAEGVLGSHMLEVSPALTTSRPRLEIHPLPILPQDDPVRLVFTADPGPGVVISITDTGDSFLLLGNAVEVQRPPEEMPHLPRGRAYWRPEPDFTTATSLWLEKGGSHHTTMSTALGLEPFADLAHILGIEWYEIDQETSRRRRP